MRRFYKDDLIGPYRVIRLFGKGGMGSVYEVEHQKLGVRYALKTFTLEHGSVILLRKRFLAEGKVLARLRHPNLVRVYDLDYDISTGTPYFTMDEILNSEGKPQTLGEMNPGCVSEETLVKWFRQLASALDYIHEKGIVHRDIKPSNILIDGAGSVMLTDFGVARYIDDELRKSLSVTTRFARSKITHDTMKMVIGTRQFMSPEVKSGEAASVTSDDYSLGMVFFWLLTGVWYRGEESQLEILKNFDYDWWTVLPWLLNKQQALRPTTLAEAVSLLLLKSEPEQQVESPIAADDPVHPRPEKTEPLTNKDGLPPKASGAPKKKCNAGPPLWGVAIICGMMLGVAQLLEPGHDATGFLILIWIVACIPFSMVAKTILDWVIAVRAASRKAKDLIQEVDVPHGKLLVCPFCHGTMEVADVPSDQQHIRCPYCDGKSKYEEKSDRLIDVWAVELPASVSQKAEIPPVDIRRRAQVIKPIEDVDKPARIELPPREVVAADNPEARKVQLISPLPGISYARQNSPDDNRTIRARRVVAERSQFVASAADKDKVQPHEDCYSPERLLSTDIAAKYQRISPNAKVEKMRRAVRDALKPRPHKELGLKERWFEFWERLKQFPNTRLWRVGIALVQCAKKIRQNYGARIRKIIVWTFVSFVALCSGLSVYFSIAGRDIETPYVGDLYPQPITKRVPDDQNIIPLLQEAAEAIDDKHLVLLSDYLRRDEIGGKHPPSRTVRVYGIENWADKVLAENERFFEILDRAAARPYSQYPEELEWRHNEGMDGHGEYWNICWKQGRFERDAKLSWPYYSPALATLRVQRMREQGRLAEAIEFAIRYGELFARFEFETENRLRSQYCSSTSMRFESEMLKIAAEDGVSDEMLVQIDAALSRWAEMRIQKCYRDLRYLVVDSDFFTGGMALPARAQFFVDCIEFVKHCWLGYFTPGYARYYYQPNRTLRDFVEIVRAIQAGQRYFSLVEQRYPSPYSLGFTAALRLLVCRNTQGVLIIGRSMPWQLISYDRFNATVNRIVIAAARYRHENGRYPISLEELAPKYLARIPHDPCSNCAIGFNAKQHIIYSVGPSGMFDGKVLDISRWDGGLKHFDYAYVRRIDGRGLPFLTPLPE